jgi:hypothetical protein
MTITLASSIPSQGETAYFINKQIELTFNKAISTSSLSNTVFSLINLDNNSSVPIRVSAGYTSAAKVVLMPDLLLVENTQYRVIILGTDQNMGVSLVAQDSDVLNTTISFEFGTGDTVYKIDSTVEKDAADLTNEGDLFLPTNVKALGFDFTLEKVRPKNHVHGVPETLTGDNTIRFTFTKDLLTGNGIDLTEWATVTLFPLLNDTAYLASGNTFGVGSIPSHTLSVTGADLLVSFAHQLPQNLGVQVSLLDGITSLEGDNYGGKLEYSINTVLYPEVYGVQAIEREVREIAGTFTQDYIGALLFKNTILGWESVGRSVSLLDPSYALKQYVMSSTILDLMEDREFYKYVMAGTRRQLGDLGVSIDNLIGRVAMKVAKYQKAKEAALESLRPGWQFRVGTTIQAYVDAMSTINRLWYSVNERYVESRFSYDQQDHPVSNTQTNRQARQNNPIW